MDAFGRGSQLVRRFLELAFTLWATTLFLGFVLGGSLLFLRHFFEPFLVKNLSGVAQVAIPDWLYFVFGIGLVVLISTLRGKPLLRDANREQFEAIEYILRNLPEQEQRLAYRSIARKMVSQFQLDSNIRMNLPQEAEAAIREEKQ